MPHTKKVNNEYLIFNALMMIFKGILEGLEVFFIHDLV